MAKNTTTEFVVHLKQGDRIRKIAVRSAAFHKPEQAKDHVEKLQKKGKMPSGTVDKVEERERTNVKRPAVLNDAITNGVTLNKTADATPDAV